VLVQRVDAVVIHGDDRGIAIARRRQEEGEAVLVSGAVHDDVRSDGAAVSEHDGGAVRVGTLHHGAEPEVAIAGEPPAGGGGGPSVGHVHLPGHAGDFPGDVGAAVAGTDYDHDLVRERARHAVAVAVHLLARRPGVQAGDVVGGGSRLRVVAVADHDGVEHLLLLLLLLTGGGCVPAPPHPPAAPLVVVLGGDGEHLRAEADEAVKVEPAREGLDVAQHLLVAREPARVDGVRSGGEGEVEEAHDLAWQVGAQGRVHAAAAVVVEPGAPDCVAALEHDGRVALAPQLARGGQPRGSRTDDGDAERARRRHGHGVV